MFIAPWQGQTYPRGQNCDVNRKVLHIKVRFPVLLCAVKTLEGDFRLCWMISPNVGQTHKENPNLVRICYMTLTLNDI